MQLFIFLLNFLDQTCSWPLFCCGALEAFSQFVILFDQRNKTIADTIINQSENIHLFLRSISHDLYCLFSFPSLRGTAIVTIVLVLCIVRIE